MRILGLSEFSRDRSETLSRRAECSDSCWVGEDGQKICRQNPAKQAMLFNCVVSSKIRRISICRPPIEARWKEKEYVLQEMRNKHEALVAQRFFSGKDIFSLRILSLGVSPVQKACHAEEAVSAQNT
jgi:hypothetical protein